MKEGGQILDGNSPAFEKPGDYRLSDSLIYCLQRHESPRVSDHKLRLLAGENTSRNPEIAAQPVRTGSRRKARPKLLRVERLFLNLDDGKSWLAVGQFLSGKERLNQIPQLPGFVHDGDRLRECRLLFSDKKLKDNNPDDQCGNRNRADNEALRKNSRQILPFDHKPEFRHDFPRPLR